MFLPFSQVQQNWKPLSNMLAPACGPQRHCSLAAAALKSRMWNIQDFVTNQQLLQTTGNNKTFPVCIANHGDAARFVLTVGTGSSPNLTLERLLAVIHPDEAINLCNLQLFCFEQMPSLHYLATSVMIRLELNSTKTPLRHQQHYQPDHGDIKVLKAINGMNCLSAFTRLRPHLTSLKATPR